MINITTLKERIQEKEDNKRKRQELEDKGWLRANIQSTEELVNADKAEFVKKVRKPRKRKKVQEPTYIDTTSDDLVYGGAYKDDELDLGSD